MAGHLLRVALTGGIATGKSHCLRRFQALGIPTIDADTLARQVIGPGTPGLAAVIARFGASIVGPEGLDRAALGRIVFADEEARRDLEAIVHPKVREAVQQWFTSEEARVGSPMPAGHSGAMIAIADIPLLYEAGREKDFDRVVVAACHPQQQVDRIMSRDRLSREEAEQRIRAQWPIDEKRARADYVIDTSGTPDETDAQVTALVDTLRAEGRIGLIQTPIRPNS